MFFNWEFESVAAENWSQKPCHCNISPSNLVISNFSNLEYFSMTLFMETSVAPGRVDEDIVVSTFFNICSILMRVSFIHSLYKNRWSGSQLLCSIILIKMLSNVLILSGGYIVQFTPHLLHILCVGYTLMKILWIKIYSTYLWPSLVN